MNEVRSERPTTTMSQSEPRGASSSSRPVTGAAFFEEDGAPRLQASFSAPALPAAKGSRLQTREWRPAMKGPVSAGPDGNSTLLWCKRSAADLLAEDMMVKRDPRLARAAAAYAASGASGLMKRRGGNPMPSTRKPVEIPKVVTSGYMRPYGYTPPTPAVQMDMESYAESQRSSSRPSTTFGTCAVGLIKGQSHADRFAGVTSGFDGGVAFAGFPQGWIRPGVN